MIKYFLLCTTVLQVSAIPFIDGPAPLHCPVKFEDLFNSVQTGANLYNQGDFSQSKEVITQGISKWANSNPLIGMECALGVSSAYRVLTFNYCANPKTNNRRAYQIGLRILHQAMNWVTHVFVKSNHNDKMIDGSQWPITIQQINEELTIVQNVLKQDRIDNGHQIHHRIPRLDNNQDFLPLSYQPLVIDDTNSKQTLYQTDKVTGKIDVNSIQAKPINATKTELSYRNLKGTQLERKHKIGIISLCAYPEDHVLPSYAISNHQIYASKHGYNYFVETQKIDQDRPHAWGKIKLLERYLSNSQSSESASDDLEWLMWMDCDTYYMNMTVTIESVLYRYAGIPQDETEIVNDVLKKKKVEMKVGGTFIPQPQVSSVSDLVLDPEVNLIIAEDNAMLNSGTFFIKKSQWSLDLMRTIYGDARTSPWVDHPWWENAALTWHFLKDVAIKFASPQYSKDLESWPALSQSTVPPGSDNQYQNSDSDSEKKFFHLLPPEEKLYYISREMEDIYTPEVRIAPQFVFNSYHPVTSRFQHDTWEPGKYILAFNGVLSSTSPTVIRMLYGNYYRQSCELNNIMDQCIEVKETLPWLQSKESLKKELFKPEDPTYGHTKRKNDGRGEL